jgi:UDP-N-acetylglucosamine acyltransferase
MSATRVHPTALIAADAQLGTGVEVGPFAIVGDSCVVGDGSVVAARATLERNVTLGSDVRVGSGSILGGAPQDVKYRGEQTTVEIGDGTVIREYTTINRATTHSFKTVVGKNCFVMSYVHLGHDCQLGDGVVLVNGVQLAGHVTIEDRAIVSGLTAVHQFVRIGRFSFIGGCSRVAQDVPPYTRAVGNPIKLYGLNSVGLRRNNFPDDVLRELKRAYRLFFRSDLNLSQAIQRAEAELEQLPDVQEFVRFVGDTNRGVVI